MATKETIITEESIKTMVDSFYGKVRKDPVIGPIFQNKIGDEWDVHLQRMYDFWSSIALSTGRYKGRPLAKHITITELAPEHFLLWLALFEANANELFASEIAGFFIDRAQKIADSLKQGVAFYRGNIEL